MIREAISTVIEGNALTQKEAAEVMAEIMSGDATEAQIGSFLTALRMKGETPEEIAGMARTMIKKALRVEIHSDLVDTCGTGGDGSNSFNISTATAVVVAGTGIPVAKHGNRAASGKCGSADLLEALGVKIDLAPWGVKRCIESIGFGFMFAPVFHPAMKYVAKPRKEMGIRTIFNVLGPLTNPAGAQKQVIGIADKSQGQLLARVLSLLGSRHGMIVHGEDGLDEITISGKTFVWEVQDGNIETYVIDAKELGIMSNHLGEIKGESVADNVAMFRSVMEGQQGPCTDIVSLNAGAAIYVAGVAGTIKEGQTIARQCLESGSARKKMEQLIETSQLIGAEEKEQAY